MSFTFTIYIPLERFERSTTNAPVSLKYVLFKTHLPLTLKIFIDSIGSTKSILMDELVGFG